MAMTFEEAAADEILFSMSSTSVTLLVVIPVSFVVRKAGLQDATPLFLLCFFTFRAFYWFRHTEGQETARHAWFRALADFFTACFATSFFGIIFGLLFAGTDPKDFSVGMTIAFYLMLWPFVLIWTSGLGLLVNLVTAFGRAVSS